MTFFEEAQTNSDLTDKEKVIVMRNTFLQQKTPENIITNVGDYLAENFGKIDGFEYKWNSLITSNPLLFEDVDYVRVRAFVDNSITPEEIQAYKDGKLHELYATLENMLICNLQYYDRIMAFCTMVFLHYVRLSDNELTSEDLDTIPFIMEMTPTQISCCAMSNQNSTEWELNYAWSINNTNIIKVVEDNKSILQSNWMLLYKNPIFAKFISYCSIRTEVETYRAAFNCDKTSNKKLGQVCSKFTRTSIAISDDQLSTLIDYVHEIDNVNQKLYNSLFGCLKNLFNGDHSQFAIYIFNREFYIHSSKFSMKVSKNENGVISKDYLANSYECFVAEEFLAESIKSQLEWARYKLPINFEYEKQILVSLLNEMVKQNYRNILCIKRMNEYGIISKLTFSGVFNNIFINEELMFDNRCIKSNKVCLSKSNAVKYIVDRGYYLFGTEKDVYDIALAETINRKLLTAHYINYCVPILQHMFEVIALHNLSKNDIIDVVCSGILNPNKLNNQNIKYTTIRGGNVDSKKLMAVGLDKQNKKNDFSKKSYWRVIENQN